MASSLLSPTDIIEFFLSTDGRTTNMQLVRRFSGHLASSGEHQQQNKDILKVVSSEYISKVSDPLFAPGSNGPHCHGQETGR